MADSDLLDRVLAPAPEDDPLLMRVLAPRDAPPAATPPAEEGGFGRSLGLGARNVAEGVLGLGAPLYDLAALPQNALNAGVKAVSGKDMGLGTTRTGSQWLEAGLDAVGLPKPQSRGEQMASRVISGMAGVIPTMGAGALIGTGRAAGSMAQRAAEMLLAKPTTQLAAGAGSGAAAQVADESGSGPIGQTLAGLAGAVGGAAVPSAALTGGRMATSMLAPMTQAGREGIVRDALLRQASDPVGLRARLMAAKADPTARLPDSPVTTAQAARDPSLAAVESGLRSDAASPGLGIPSPMARFAALDTERNAARVAALSAPAPEAGAAFGAELRGGLDEAKGLRTAQRTAAHDAIDPDNASRIPMMGLQQKMIDLQNKYYGAMSGGLPRDINEMAHDIFYSSPTVPWSHVENLRARLTTLANDHGNDARAQAVIGQMKASLDDTVARASHPMEPQPAGPATLANVGAEAAAEGATQRPDVAEALRQERLPLNQQSSAYRDGQKPAHEGLASFLIARGGLKNDGGELMHMLGDTRARPALYSREGMNLDRAREIAHEAGFLPSNVEINGANGSSVSDLIDALRSDLNNPGGRSSGLVRNSTLPDQVERMLDERHGLSLRDDPEKVLSAVRDPEFGRPAGAPAPDGFAPIDNALTPEAAARAREALTMDRQFGQDFGLDQTGSRAVSNILQRGQGGGWNVPDQSVMAQALSSPNAVRQVLRAGGQDALPQMRQAYMERAYRAAVPDGAVSGADGSPVMRAPGFMKFMDQTKDTAPLLFDKPQLDRLHLLVNDFAETASAQAMARARGSDTARNLSVANVISATTRGLVDPSAPGAQAVLSMFGGITRATGAEAATKLLLTQAMADPELAARLLAKATPDAMERARSYITSTMGERLGGLAGDAAGRTTLRGSQAGSDTGQDRPRPPPPAVFMPPQPQQTPEARRRAAMVDRLIKG